MRGRGTRDPLGWVWSDMKDRCLNPSYHHYHRYGGRGITIHEPWINDSQAFIDWVRTNLGDRPEGMSLDRIDNDGNYEPGNLRWATKRQQSANRQQRLGASGETGVVQVANGSWRVTLHIGTFDTIEEATEAYTCARSRLDGH